MYLDEIPLHLKIQYAERFCLSLEITVEANLSPEGSPVKIKIFFISLK